MDAMNRGNCKGLKLVEKKMKVFESVLGDVPSKELRSTRCSAALCQVITVLIQFSL